MRSRTIATRGKKLKRCHANRLDVEPGVTGYSVWEGESVDKKLAACLAILSVMLFAATSQSAQAVIYTKVGVSVGATANYSIIEHYHGQVHLEVTDISGTVVTIKLSGDASTSTLSGDISTYGGGVNMSFFVFVPGLRDGDALYRDSSTYVVSAQDFENVSGADRIIDHANVSDEGSFMSVSWDQATGLLVGLRVIGSLIGIMGEYILTLENTSLWEGGSHATVLDAFALVGSVTIVALFLAVGLWDSRRGCVARPAV
jgi:hypothetical protein